MGPFLADHVPSRLDWLCGVALVASAISFARLPTDLDPVAPPQRAIRGCKPRVEVPVVDTRKLVAVGPMLEAGSYRDVMRETVRAELVKSSPWRIELTDTPNGGFYVDGTVDEMTVSHVGNVTRVRCELKLWVRSSTTPISLLSGSASVDTTKGQRDIALSRQACVATVAEELVERLMVGDPWD
ncbi:MAG: hypothetical protein H0V17_22845 [Deltaproteobacteria bacterium]|nr:hypothetical protein [Deltaproteobacteria bacterium]